VLGFGKRLFGFALKLVPGGAAASIIPWGAGALLLVAISCWAYVVHLRHEVADDQAALATAVAVNQANTKQLNILKQDQKVVDEANAELAVKLRRLQLLAPKASAAVSAAANNTAPLTPSEAAVIHQLQVFQERGQ
jgi:hypothetical protein